MNECEMRQKRAAVKTHNTLKFLLCFSRNEACRIFSTALFTEDSLKIPLCAH